MAFVTIKNPLLEIASLLVSDIMPSSKDITLDTHSCFALFAFGCINKILSEDNAAAYMPLLDSTGDFKIGVKGLSWKLWF